MQRRWRARALMASVTSEQIVRAKCEGELKASGCVRQTSGECAHGECPQCELQRGVRTPAGSSGRGRLACRL